MYVHKHLAFNQDFWEIIEGYMKSNGVKNFTDFVKKALMKQINQ